MRQRGFRKLFILAVFLMATFVLLVAPSEARRGGGHSEGASIEDAQSVVVKYTAVEVKPKKGKSITITHRARTIDLMDEDVNISSILSGTPLAGGEYKWIRLKVEANKDVVDSFIKIDGTDYSLWMPGGDRTGLKIGNGFHVDLRGNADHAINFDLKKSVRKPKGKGGNFVLRSTLKLKRDNHAIHSSTSVDSGDDVLVGPGSISGTVALSLLQVRDMSCDRSTAVYLFQGFSIEPDDVDSNAPNPIATAYVLYDSNIGTYAYGFDSVNAGDYTVAFTCQVMRDYPDTDDAITFSSRGNVSVAPGTESVFNLQ